MKLEGSHHHQKKLSVRARQEGWVAAARVWGTRGVGTGEREREAQGKRTEA